MTMPSPIGGEHHYFATTSARWIVDSDPYDALDRLRKQHGKMRNVPYNLWIVPGHVDTTHYDIDHFAPQIEDATLVAVGTFNRSQ